MRGLHYLKPMFSLLFTRKNVLLEFRKAPDQELQEIFSNGDHTGFSLLLKGSPAGVECDIDLGRRWADPPETALSGSRPELHLRAWEPRIDPLNRRTNRCIAGPT